MTATPPFTFDLIDAAGFGYTRVWQERHYLLRLALIPLMIKFVSALAYHMLGYDDPFLRRGLVMMLATFAEGWVLAQFLRTLLLGERWPRPLPETRDEAAFQQVILRARGIVSATIVFVLISIANTVLGWGAYSIDMQAQALIDERAAAGGAESAGSSLLLIPAIASVVLVIWAFRLVWLYIPYSILMPAKEYLRRLGGFSASVRLLGLFLICVIPCGVFANILAHALASPFGGSDAETLPAMIEFIILFINSATDMLTSLIVTAGMAYAMRGIVPHSPGELQDISRRDI